MGQKNSLGHRFTPPARTTPPQSRSRTVDVSSSSDEPPAEDGIGGTSPDASSQPATRERVEAAQNKLLIVPTFPLSMTEERITVREDATGERRYPKWLPSVVAWGCCGAALLAPVVYAAAYLDQDVDSLPIERHPAMVIPLTGVAGGLLTGAMRYLHLRLFG